MNTPADAIDEVPPDGDLAGEYVLGVLGADERRAAAQRIGRDPGLAREVADWEERLMPLIDEIAPVPTPYALWPRIRAAAGLAPAAGLPAAHGDARGDGVWQSAPFWRWLTAGAFATAAASLVALYIAPRTVAPPTQQVVEPLYAKMSQDDGTTLFTATVDTARGTMLVLPTTVQIPAGRVPQLWLIPPGGSPHSLGMLDPSKANAVVVPKDLLASLGPRSIVAVSVEPPGGSPGVAPSGPIIAKGEISML